jgi:hypothetical protein
MCPVFIYVKSTFEPKFRAVLLQVVFGKRSLLLCAYMEREKPGVLPCSRSSNWGKDQMGMEELISSMGRQEVLALGNGSS